MTVAEPALATADTLPGAPGVPTGVTDCEELEALPAPEPFVAVTVNVYAVPLVRPVMIQLVADDCVQVFPPGDEVTV